MLRLVHWLLVDQCSTPTTIGTGVFQISSEACCARSLTQRVEGGQMVGVLALDRGNADLAEAVSMAADAGRTSLPCSHHPLPFAWTI